jgi:hypothetical protein
MNPYSPKVEVRTDTRLSVEILPRKEVDVEAQPDVEVLELLPCGHTERRSGLEVITESPDRQRHTTGRVEEPPFLRCGACCHADKAECRECGGKHRTSHPGSSIN